MDDMIAGNTHFFPLGKGLQGFTEISNLIR